MQYEHPLTFWEQEEGLILKALRGSITYGTNLTPQLAKQYDLPPSDHDEIGILVPPKTHTIGLQNFETLEKKVSETKQDLVMYSLKFYMQKAMDCNPNMLEPMFLEPKHYKYLHPVAKELIKHRELFLSKKAKDRYMGYAYSQLKKLQVKRENTTGRVDLVEKFGYDTKFAMHAIRLLAMGLEILVDGHLTVERPENNRLLDIRLGKFKLEEVMDMAEHYMDLMEKAWIQCKLPRVADVNKISKLCVDLHEMYWES